MEIDGLVGLIKFSLFVLDNLSCKNWMGHVQRCVFLIPTQRHDFARTRTSLSYYHSWLLDLSHWCILYKLLLIYLLPNYGSSVSIRIYLFKWSLRLYLAPLILVEMPVLILNKLKFRFDFCWLRRQLNLIWTLRYEIFFTVTVVYSFRKVWRLSWFITFFPKSFPPTVFRFLLILQSKFSSLVSRSLPSLTFLIINFDY